MTRLRSTQEGEWNSYRGGVPVLVTSKVSQVQVVQVVYASNAKFGDNRHKFGLFGE